MNKKGNTLVIVLIILAVIGIIAYSQGVIKLPSSCPPGVIPERVMLVEPRGGHSFGLYPQNNRWADGSNMETTVYCPSGSLEGENSNYNYCKDLFYKYTPIDSNGIVGTVTSYNIDLIVDVGDVEGIGGSVKVISYKCRKI